MCHHLVALAHLGHAGADGYDRPGRAIGAGPPICQLPTLTSSSQLPMPAATTSIRTSPTAGVASSSISRISTGSPSAVIPAARILLQRTLLASVIRRGHASREGPPEQAAATRGESSFA